MHAVDLFAGAGGWDIAAEKLGIHCIGVECWDPAIQTRRAAGLLTQADYCEDLDPLWFSHCEGLIASPPCQTFSTAGSGQGNGYETRQRIEGALSNGLWNVSGLDHKTKLVLEPMRWIRTRYAAGNPFKWIAFEQVPSCLSIWDAYAHSLGQIGYSTFTGNLSAEQFGVPQSRKRAILVAVLGPNSKVPQPTHSRYHISDPTKLDEGMARWTTMAQALDLSPKGTLVSNYQGGGAKGTYSFRSLDAPSVTITGKANRNRITNETVSSRPNSLLNFERSMTLEEAAVLQDFPAYWPWHGNDSAKYQQVGNAFPPGFALAVLQAATGVQLDHAQANREASSGEAEAQTGI